MKSKLSNSSYFTKNHIPWNKGLKGWTEGTTAGFQRGNKLTLWKGKKHKMKSIIKMRESHKGCIPWNTGKKVPQTQNKNHWKWKGEKAEYTSHHSWVVRRLGKPDICKNCGKIGLYGHKIHWANLSRKYKRNLSDWMRLCVSCHKNYDLGNIIL